MRDFGRDGKMPNGLSENVSIKTGEIYKEIQQIEQNIHKQQSGHEKICDTE